MGVTELPRPDRRLRVEFKFREDAIRNYAGVDQLEPRFHDSGDLGRLEDIMRPFAFATRQPFQSTDDLYNEAIEELTQLLESYYDVEYPLPRDHWMEYWE